MRHESGTVRVLEVVDNLGVGGAEIWLMEILRLWSRTGGGRMDFLITGDRRDDFFEKEARALGATVYHVRYSRRSLADFSRQFRRILRERNYDAVHDHADFASGWHFALGTGALPDIRVTHVHNPSYQIRNNYGLTIRRRLTASIGKVLVSLYSTHITATSHQMLAEYGFTASVFRHIPKAALYCGFDPGRFRGDVQAYRASVRNEFGWPHDAVIILVAGRIDQSAELRHPQNHKNSAFSVAVGLECARRDERVRLLFAGKPSPAVPIFQARISAAGFQNRFAFAGVRGDIERLMLASDVLLFPSRGEGLGMVAVEAQAAGLPVLASTRVPHECVVVPELVHFRDIAAGVPSWTTDLISLLQCRRDAVSANAQVGASRFAISHSAQALADLYSRGVLA